MKLKPFDVALLERLAKPFTAPGEDARGAFTRAFFAEPVRCSGCGQPHAIQINRNGKTLCMRCDEEAGCTFWAEGMGPRPLKGTCDFCVRYAGQRGAGWCSAKKVAP